jgi:hypothetical protein
MLSDTDRLVDLHRLALLRVLVGLFALAGLKPGTGVIETLPRGVKYAILKVLRRAESATRRLVAIEAEKLDDVDYVPPPKHEKSGAKRSGAKRSGEKKTRAPRMPQFQLIDPRKFFEELYPNRRARRAAKKLQRGGPPKLLFRYDCFDGQPACEAWSDPLPELTSDDLLTATGICRRMQALHHALNDLPAQAARMKREIAKRKAAKPGPGSVPPLRIGLPPGYRKGGKDEIDLILRACHWLVTQKDAPPDGVDATI